MECIGLRLSQSNDPGSSPIDESSPGETEQSDAIVRVSLFTNPLKSVRQRLVCLVAYVSPTSSADRRRISRSQIPPNLTVTERADSAVISNQ